MLRYYFHSPSGFCLMHSVLHYRAAYTLGPALPSTGSYYPSVSMRLIYGGTGISTSYPSPTAIVLGLGPDLPWADEPSPGNLGLSTCKFLAYISLLIPAFSLLHRPRLLPVPLQPVHYAPLPLVRMNTALVLCLAPGINLPDPFSRLSAFFSDPRFRFPQSFAPEPAALRPGSG